MREFFFKEEVSEAVVPGVVIRVIHLDDAVFDAKGVLEIFASLAAAEFGGPAGEVLAIEK